MEYNDDLIDEDDELLEDEPDLSDPLITDEGQNWIIRSVNRIKRSLGFETEGSKIKTKRKRSDSTQSDGSTENKPKKKHSKKKKEKLANAVNGTKKIAIRQVNRRQTE